jgi:hypothetical protein
MFEVLEDLSGVEDLDLSVYQNRHLAFRVDPENLRVLWVIVMVHRERHHHHIDRNAFSSAAIWTFAPNMLNGPEYRVMFVIGRL